ncbi:unnamed protein product, partial [marine sediment metagenome]
GQKVHALSYVTRATFLDWTWDKTMARELHGFRNQLYWGRKAWQRAPVWSLDDLPGDSQPGISDSQAKAVASLQTGACPECGLPIEWGRFLPMSMLPGLGGYPIGGGYWQLPYVRPPPYRLDLSRLETMDIPPRNLAKTLGGSYVKADIALSRWAEFEAQHRRRATWLRELEALKSQAGTSFTEVYELSEKSFEYRKSLGGFGGRDLTHRTPIFFEGICNL